MLTKLPQILEQPQLAQSQLTKARANNRKTIQPPRIKGPTSIFMNNRRKATIIAEDSTSGEQSNNLSYLEAEQNYANAKVDQDDKMLPIIEKEYKDNSDAKAIYLRIKNNKFFSDFSSQFDSKFQEDGYWYICRNIQLKKCERNEVIYKAGDYNNNKIYIVYDGNIAQCPATKSINQPTKRRSRTVIKNSSNPGSPRWHSPSKMSSRNSSKKNLRMAKDVVPIFSLNITTTNEMGSQPSNRSTPRSIFSPRQQSVDYSGKPYQLNMTYIEANETKYQQEGVFRYEKIIEDDGYFGMEGVENKEYREKSMIAKSEGHLLVLDAQIYKLAKARYGPENRIKLDYIIKSLPQTQLTEDTLAFKLTQTFSDESFNFGNKITVQGELGETFYLIYQGSVVVSKIKTEGLKNAKQSPTKNMHTPRKPISLIQLGPGSFLGEEILFQNLYEYTVEANSANIQLLAFDKNKFLKEFEGDLTRRMKNAVDSKSEMHKELLDDNILNLQTLKFGNTEQQTVGAATPERRLSIFDITPENPLERISLKQHKKNASMVSPEKEHVNRGDIRTDLPIHFHISPVKNRKIKLGNILNAQSYDNYKKSSNNKKEKQQNGNNTIAMTQSTEGSKERIYDLEDLDYAEVTPGTQRDRPVFERITALENAGKKYQTPPRYVQALETINAPIPINTTATDAQETINNNMTNEGIIDTQENALQTAKKNNLGIPLLNFSKVSTKGAQTSKRSPRHNHTENFNSIQTGRSVRAPKENQETIETQGNNGIQGKQLTQRRDISQQTPGRNLQVGQRVGYDSLQASLEINKHQIDSYKFDFGRVEGVKEDKILLNSRMNKIMDKKVEYEDMIKRKDFKTPQDMLDELGLAVSTEKRIIRASYNANYPNKKQENEKIQNQLKEKFFTSDTKNVKHYLQKYKDTVSNSIGYRKKLVFNSEDPQRSNHRNIKPGPQKKMLLGQPGTNNSLFHDSLLDFELETNDKVNKTISYSQQDDIVAKVKFEPLEQKKNRGRRYMNLSPPKIFKPPLVSPVLEVPITRKRKNYSKIVRGTLQAQNCYQPSYLQAPENKIKVKNW